MLSMHITEEAWCFQANLNVVFLRLKLRSPSSSLHAIEDKTSIEDFCMGSVGFGKFKVMIHVGPD